MHNHYQNSVPPEPKKAKPRIQLSALPRVFQEAPLLFKPPRNIYWTKVMVLTREEITINWELRGAVTHAVEITCVGSAFKILNPDFFNKWGQLPKNHDCKIGLSFREDRQRNRTVVAKLWFSHDAA